MYGDNNYGSNKSYGSNNRRSGYGGNSYGGRSSNNYRRPTDNISFPNVKNEPITNFEKNFYVPTKTLSDEQARNLREQCKMKIQGENIPLPVADFTSLGFPEKVVQKFTEMGFSTPTPIQAQGWPMALSGRDMVGIADTGSGKTLSFVLPALIHASAQTPLREGDGPIVLILAPTRELVCQIEVVCNEYAPMFGMKSTCLYGGASIVPQKKSLAKGVDIVVATPGRLIDLHNQGFCPLDRVTFLVLDEADRMLDMGFEPQLNDIIPKTNKNRQTLMWSATWPKEVRALANNYASKDYIQVTIGDGELTVNKKIKQQVEIISSHDKQSKLLFLLQDRKSDRCIIFANMKSTCDKLEYILQDKGFHCAAIHGNKSQSARDTVIEQFRSGRKNILIATDVAARGLDIKDVKIVINYDLPRDIEDYVHRVGRTARGDATSGISFTMFAPEEDASNARKFVELLKKSEVKIPSELEEIANRNNRSSYSRYSNSSRNYRGGSNFGSGGYGGKRY